MLARFCALTFALTVPAGAVVPPPPITVAPPTDPAERKVLSWQVGEATCAKGGAMAPAALVLPDPQPLVGRFMPEPADVTVSFDLDSAGRAFNIRNNTAGRVRMQTGDIMPSLRASRFAVSAALSDCTITYVPVIESLTEAPLETLARLGVAQRARIDKAMWDRMSPGDCRNRPRAAPLMRAFPDWRKLQRREGTREWSYVTYDLDGGGVPVNVATLISSGDEALDAETRTVAAAGRFAAGPRNGCVQVWWSGPAAIPAPPIPSDAEGNPACDIADRWEKAPRLIYPRAYSQRAIEGWAILRFDVAPWGEIGEIEVLDAQPSSDFGDAAVNVLRAARFKPLESGLSGCVDRVIFRIRAGQKGAEGGATALEAG